MATYVIGDIQGCYQPLMHLLEKIKFNENQDQLWFAGDLVNRGPDSLAVLRFIKNLGEAAVCVLGNHDLHLLALSQGNSKHQSDDGLQQVLQAKDREELIDWLRQKPFFFYSKKKEFAMVHAGVLPQWDLQKVLALNQEMQQVLQNNKSFNLFCQNMYGNEPALWSDSLTGMERLRCITNSFTRLRYCSSAGKMSMKENGAVGTQAKNLYPWFDIKRESRDIRIVFGHWSTLGYYQKDNIWAIDSGCLWGGQLTALRIRKKKPSYIIQWKCNDLKSLN